MLKLYDDTHIQNIATAIRSKNGKSTLYRVADMASAIDEIESAENVLPQDEIEATDIANFPDGSNGYPVVDLKAYIEPVQEGTGDPSPENVRPISGFTECVVTRIGKNLFDVSAYPLTQKALVRFETGTFATSSVNNRYATEDYIPCKHLRGKTVVLNNKPVSSTTAGTAFYDDNKTYISGVGTTNSNGVWTFPANASYFRFTTDKPSGGNDAQIEIGTSATAYEAYNAQIKTIDFDTAGTVYAGVLDVTSGVLTVTHALVELTEEWNWKKSSSYSMAYYVSVGDMDSNVKAQGEIIFCTHAIPVPSTNEYVLGTCLMLNAFNIWILDSESTVNTVAKWKNYIVSQREGGTPIKALMELDTKPTYQLTAEEVDTLLGVNNIYASTGKVYVKYRADVDLYIQKKLAEG